MLRTVIMASVLAAAAADAHAQTPALTDMLAAVRPSVVHIEVTTDDGLTGGSGFVVDGAKGLIVTADFVLAGSSKISVRQGDGNGHGMQGKIVAIDEVNHVGLIEVSDHSMRALTFCDTAPRMGEPAFVVSYPFKLGPLAFAGIVSSPRVNLKDLDFPVLVTDAGTHFGSAGAPVLAASGCVMAMSYAKIGMPNDTPEFNLGIAVPAQHVQAALQR